jgi:hypothetical protein
MQSTTMAGATNYNECMVEVGKWAYSQGGPQAQTAYQTLYGLYLGSQHVVSSTAGARSSSTTQEPRAQRPRTQRPRQRTGAAARTGARVRTPAGQVGIVDSKVLAQIVANPNIATEALRKRPTLRNMTANILGTCISRLLKGGYISGTAKVGPFSATPAGINATQKQPTSIGQARQARQARRRTATPSAPTTGEPTAATA